MPEPSTEPKIDLTQVSIDLPLFDQFFELVLAIAQQQSEQPLSTTDQTWVDGPNGFILNPMDHWTNGGYFCTPVNTLAFAHTGMDGEHFSFLVKDLKITSSSPVVYTAPMKYEGENNIIIAPTFKIFLRLGLRYGFYELGNLLETPTQTLDKLRSEPSPEESLEPFEAEEREFLSAIATQLKLTPYSYSVDDFITLQLRYLPDLILSHNYS